MAIEMKTRLFFNAPSPCHFPRETINNSKRRLQQKRRGSTSGKNIEDKHKSITCCYEAFVLLSHVNRNIELM